MKDETNGCMLTHWRGHGLSSFTAFPTAAIRAGHGPRHFASVGIVVLLIDFWHTWIIVS